MYLETHLHVLQCTNKFFNQSIFLDFGKRFYCDRCPRSYRHKCGLRRHIMLECGKAPQFQCDVCSRRFHQKSTLKTHYALKHSRVVFTF